MKMETPTRKMEIIEINVDKITVNPNQPRKEFDKDKLKELANSIKENGLINPIQVKKSGSKYQLVCGERRLKAHKLAKIKKIKAIVKEYKGNQNEMVESLIENLQRADLSSVEKENYVYLLWKTGNYKSKKDLGKALGLSDPRIRNLLNAHKLRKETNTPKEISTRVLEDVFAVTDLKNKKKILNKVIKKELAPVLVRDHVGVINKSPEEIRNALLNNQISPTQAKNILKFTDEKTRRKLIKAHKEIKNLDKNLEKFEAKRKLSERDIIKTKESIDNFRQASLEAQRENQTATRMLIKAISMSNLMDDKQLKQLRYFQELFETGLDNIQELSQNLKQKLVEAK
jgi:ParB family chromosome partitioning protein